MTAVMPDVRRRMSAAPVARIAVEIAGLRPLRPPEGLVVGGRAWLPHLAVTRDLVKHLALKGALAANLYHPSRYHSAHLWRYVQIHPTLTPVTGRFVGGLVYDWSARFGLLLPLVIFDTGHAVTRAEIGGDPSLYAALSLTEIGRAKGLLCDTGAYGTYAVTKWDTREISPLGWAGAAWLRS